MIMTEKSKARNKVFLSIFLAMVMAVASSLLENMDSS